MSLQRPATVSSHAISQRLSLYSSRAESCLDRLRCLVQQQQHVDLVEGEWVVSRALRDACLASQRATSVPWDDVASLSHHELAQRTRLDDQYALHMQQLRDDWYSINASNPGSIRVFHSTPDGNCFFYTLSQHLTGSEDHQSLLRLHTVIELLLNIEYYMNFINGCISAFGGYVNVHSTANGAYRLRCVLKDACSDYGWVPSYLAAPASVVLHRSIVVHCPLNVAQHVNDASFTALYPPSRHRTLHMAWENCGYNGVGLVMGLNHFVGVSTTAADDARSALLLSDAEPTYDVSTAPDVWRNVARSDAWLATAAACGRHGTNPVSGAKRPVSVLTNHPAAPSSNFPGVSCYPRTPSEASLRPCCTSP